MHSRRLRYFKKSFWQFTLPMLIPLLTLATFSIVITQGYIKAQIDANNEYALSLAQNTIETLVSESDSVSINFNLNAPFILRLKGLLEYSNSEFVGASAHTAYMNLINTVANSRPYVESVYLYYNNAADNFLVSNQGVQNISEYIDNSWYTLFKEMADDEDVLVRRRELRRYPFEEESVSVITVFRKFHMPGLSGARGTGVVAVNIKCGYVENELSNYLLMDRQAIAVFDQYGGVVAESSGSEAQAFPVHEEWDADGQSNSRYIISRTQSEKYGLKFMSVAPKSDLYKLPAQLIVITLILSLFSCLAGGMLAYNFSRKSHDSLLAIIDIFERAETGAPLPALPDRPSVDEYDYILRNITKTFIEQHYLNVQLSEKKYRLQVMELLALQSQINPHFLSNTLKTIFWKTTSLTGGQNDASRMIEDLTSILAYCFGGSHTFVPLREEIDYSESYIKIQKVRYKDRMRVIWQYDEDITDVKVMKMLLQPLLENSIYHGIKEKADSGLIIISMKLRCERLCVAIFDDGAGIEPGRLRELKENLRGSEESDAHIGLANTYKRLKILYGSELRFNLKSEQGVGAAIFISFPVRE